MNVNCRGPKIGKGKALFSLRRYAEAKVVFQELIIEQPNVIESYDCLAKIQMAGDEYKIAQKTLMGGNFKVPKSSFTSNGACTTGNVQ